MQQEYITALNAFIEDLRHGFCLRHSVNSEYTFGRIYIGKVFEECFGGLLTGNPDIHKIIPCTSEERRDFEQIFQSNNSAEFHVLLSNIATAAEEDSILFQNKDSKKCDVSNLNWMSSRENIQILQFFAEVFLIIALFTDSNPKVTWCQVCFRISARGKAYCRVHNYKTNENENDQNSARKIHDEFLLEIDTKTLTRKLNSKWAYCRLLRQTPELEPAHLINERLNIVHNHWDISKKIWQQWLEEEFPFVNSKFSAYGPNYECWSKFIKSVRQAIEQDPAENAEDPKLFFMELSMANEWYRLESDMLNSKKARILTISKLYARGISPKEIGVRMNLSLSHVYRNIKEILNEKNQHNLNIPRLTKVEKG